MSDAGYHKRTRREDEWTNYKFVIYARRSIEKKEDEIVQSTQDQLRVMRKIADDCGFKVVKEFSEEKSAGKAGNRSAFTEMVEFIEAGKANAILCWDYDRLSRNLEEGGKIGDLRIAGAIKLIKTPSKDYISEENSLLGTIETVMATEYVRKLKENIKRGQAGSALRGFRPCLAPIGYKNTKYRDERLEESEVDEPNFTIIRKIFEAILSRQYTPHQVYDLATQEWGLKARKTRRNPTCRPISLHGFYNLLSNPYYYGWYQYPAKHKELAQWYKGNHTPVITKAQFDEVQQILGKKGAKPQKHIHAYVGLMRCGGCGARITCEKKFKRQQNGNVHEYSYYRCTGQVRTCKQKTIEVKKLEETFVDFLSSIQIAPEFHQWAMAELKKEYEKEATDKDSVMFAHQQRLRDVSARLNNLFEMRLEGDIDSARFKAEQSRLEDEERSLKGKVEATEAKFKTWIDDAERLLTFAERAKEEFLNGGQQKRRAIIAALGTEHVLEQGILTFQTERPIEVLIQGKDLSQPPENIRTSKKQGNKTQKGTFVPNREIMWRWADLNRRPRWVATMSLQCLVRLRDFGYVCMRRTESHIT